MRLVIAAWTTAPTLEPCHCRHLCGEADSSGHRDIATAALPTVSREVCSVRDTGVREVGPRRRSRGVRRRGLQLFVERRSHSRAHCDHAGRRSAAHLSTQASSIVVRSSERRLRSWSARLRRRHGRGDDNSTGSTAPVVRPQQCVHVDVSPHHRGVPPDHRRPQLVLRRWAHDPRGTRCLRASTSRPTTRGSPDAPMTCLRHGQSRSTRRGLRT